MKAAPNNSAPTKHVGIWIRVSTEDQARGESPEHHERRARYYAEAKGWEVKEVYHLEGVSGKAVKAHPEAKRMMAEVKSGHITGLIFSKLARLARDTRELLDFSDLFREAEADLISIQESIDTSTPSGRLFYTMIAAMAQWEREEIVSRITASVAVRAKLGKSLGGKAPFGYQWKDKRLVLNPDEAPVRKLMYELFAEHKRKRTVARMLNERGFRTRKGDFTDTTVERLIRDTTAKGEHRTNYTRSAGTNKKWSLKPEHDWVINQVDPIVSIPLWEECNELLNGNRTTRVRKGRPPVHAFAGFVQCECGEKMKVPSNSPKYICAKCKNKIPIEDLDNIFREELKGYLLSPEKLAVYLNGASETLAQKEELLQSLRREQGRVKREVEQLFALYHGGGLTPNQFKEHYTPIESRKAKLEAEIPHTEAEIALLKIDSLSSEEITAEAKVFYAKWPTLPSEGKRDLVEKLVQNIVIGNGEISINLCYMPSFENMAEKQRTLIVALHFCHLTLTAKIPKGRGYPHNPQTIGQHIRKRRMDLNMKQKCLGAKLGTDESSVWNWENDRNKPEIRFLPAILAFLGYDPRPMPCSLSEQLISYREGKGWSQAHFARVLGFDPTTLARWERGERQPNVEFQKRIQAALVEPASPSRANSS